MPRPLRLIAIVGLVAVAALTAACGPSGPIGAAAGANATPPSVSAAVAVTPPADASSETDTATPAAAGGGRTPSSPAGESSPDSASVGGQGPDLATKGCTGIKLSDAQALLKSTVTKIDFQAGSAELDPAHQFECQFNDQAMLVTVDPEDTAHAVYKQDVADQLGDSKPLAGIGEEAVDAGLVLSGLMHEPPTVIARSGAVTCKVETSGGKDLSIAIDPGPMGGSTVDESAAYAKLMGALCNDIFAALT